MFIYYHNKMKNSISNVISETFTIQFYENKDFSQLIEILNTFCG